ncbi:inositol monophosphatase family protein [Kineobactrum salinum]|uniref:Nus factor SuhB n=1 Tax=Kineobactrum salinum TaxID=2708301 RepID=A0A6C0TY03_9GAMM|nr:inositol monophosphatase [Kineobactrum salinum]QIB64279.1 inositol monophosphatase [Kineobactrum salinum]
MNHSDELDLRLATAVSVARSAGEFALACFADLGALNIRSKGVQDMATEADLRTEQLIREQLLQHYPDDGFLGEESCADYEVREGQGVWVVDPIDGTQPFVSNINSWCVILAYVEQDRTELAVIYDPNRDELFAARRGCGATVNGSPLATTEAMSLADGLVGIGYSTRVPPEAALAPMTRLLAADGMFHRCGSGGLSLAYVAAGRLLAYYEPHMNCWDSVAGALLVREAGGCTNAEVESVAVMQHGSAVLAAGKGIYAALEVVAGVR